jgi:hypothetical protein
MPPPNPAPPTPPGDARVPPRPAPAEGPHENPPRVVLPPHVVTPPLVAVNLPSPTPLVTEGDQIYETYRKGLISRHVCKNGRLLEWVALESIDEAEGRYWLGFDGHISVKDSSGRTRRFSIDNTRYSMEQPTSVAEAKPYLWLPLIAPLKYPGTTTDDAYDVVAGSGDNPNYYGGMALAAFCIEHLHGVSAHSMEYARRLVGFMLCSETPAFSGYIARRARPFNTEDNPDGSPFLRGGSAEEVLGTMLGLMFYLRTEDAAHPLHAEARALRDRLLAQVEASSIQYHHPYFTESFPIAHFEYPIFASAGVEKGFLSEEAYRVPLENRPFIGSLGNHFDYAMYLTSMILIMESTLPDATKEKWAGRFFDFIKNSLSGPEAADLAGNSYFGAALLMVNRYRNPQRKPRLFNASDDGPWLSGALESVTTVGQPTSAPGPRLFWEHDLPFQSKKADESSDEFSTNMHRPGAIGAHFEWVLSPPYHRHTEFKWWSVMPGWIDFSGKSYEGIPAQSMSGAEYLESAEKRYAIEPFARRELVERGHKNTQIEGAGLGLFFLRMLVTHVDPGGYPPPRLALDELYPSLPCDGVEPLSPVTLRCASVYDGRHPTLGGPRKVGGDRPKSVAVLTMDEGRCLVTACAREEDEHLRLDTWTTDQGAIVHQASAHGSRFDLVALAPMTHSLFVVAERAEEHHLLARDDHWLRVSLWRAGTSEVSRLAVWNSTANNPGSKDPSSVQKLDVAAIDAGTCVVMSKSQNGINRLRVFKVDDGPAVVTPLMEHPGLDAQDGTDNNDEDVCVVTARDRLVVYSVHNGDRVHFVVRRWIPETASLDLVQRTQAVPGRLLDAAIVSALGRDAPQHLVAVVKAGDFLVLHAWAIQPGGGLVWGGCLDTTRGNHLLLSREKDYDVAWIASRSSYTQPWFVIAGDGHAISVKQGGGNGSWKDTGRGIKLLHGRVLPDGSPTIEGMTLVGGGNGPPEMLAVAASTLEGVFVVNKSPKGDLHLRRWDVVGELRT